jgi:protein-disulfide isomerase
VRTFAAASAFALAAIVASGPASAQQKDWTKTVALSAENGFVVGNPNAPVKLVEYASLTCPHCAHFSEEASVPLMSYVRQGKVRYEFRNFVLNGIDLTATMLAHCAGTSRFFPFVESLYSTQRTWVGQISGLPTADKDKLKNLPEGERMHALAKAGGLVQAAAVHGVPEAQAKRCLADSQLVERLTSLREAGSAAGVQGTPTFFLNGEQLPVNAWPDVDSAIRRAMGERG